MRVDDRHLALEDVLADQLKPVLSELRMTELATFVDHVVNRRSGNIDEIISAATELHFAPGFIHYGSDADVRLDWNERPLVSLGVTISDAHFTAFVRLVLGVEHAGIALQHVTEHRRHDLPPPDDAMIRAFARNRLAGPDMASDLAGSR